MERLHRFQSVTTPYDIEEMCVQLNSQIKDEQSMKVQDIKWGDRASHMFMLPQKAQKNVYTISIILYR